MAHPNKKKKKKPPLWLASAWNNCFGGHGCKVCWWSCSVPSGCGVSHETWASSEPWCVFLNLPGSFPPQSALYEVKEAIGESSAATDIQPGQLEVFLNHGMLDVGIFFLSLQVTMPKATLLCSRACSHRRKVSMLCLWSPCYLWCAQLSSLHCRRLIMLISLAEIVAIKRYSLESVFAMNNLNMIQVCVGWV